MQRIPGSLGPLARLLFPPGLHRSFDRFGAADLLAGACGQDRASEDANGEEGKVHECGGLPDYLLNQRRKGKVHHSSIVHAHEYEQQEDEDEKQRLEQQLRIHKFSGGGR